jgi:hypothetical protein
MRKVAECNQVVPGMTVGYRREAVEIVDLAEGQDEES